MSVIGERVRAMRLDLGLSQAELGAGRYTGSYISHIESGRRQPTGEVLTYLAGRLGLPLADLTGDQQAQSDTEVAGDLSAVRRMIGQHKWDAAVRLAEAASKLASDNGLDARVWEADYLLATAYQFGGRYSEAAELAAELAERPIIAGSPGLRAEVRTLASRAHRACGRLSDATSHAEAAVADAEDADPGLLGAAMVAQLGACVMAGDMKSAEPVVARLEELFDQLDGVDACEVAWALGNAAFGRGDADAGRMWHDRGAELANPQVDPRGWARLHQSIAYYLVAKGGPADLPAAQEHFESSKPIIMLLGGAGDLADLRLLQARLALRGGQPETARALLDHLVDEAATLGDVRLEADVHEALADTLLALDDTAGAGVQLRRAALCFEHAQAPDRALALWHRYAEVTSA